jgi:hypothetical protein
MNRNAVSLAIFLLATLAPASAQTIRFWSAVGSGSWNDPANWSGGSIPNSTNDLASIGVAATVTLDQATGFTVGGLITGSATVSIEPGTGGALSVQGPAPVVTNVGTLNLNVPLTSRGFTKQGAGALLLSSDNRAGLAGATLTVAEGQLRGYSGATGNGYELGAATTTLTIQSGAQLRFFNVTSGDRAYAPILHLNGAGGSNPGALNNDSQTTANNPIWSGDLILDSPATIGAQNQGNYTLGRIRGIGQTLTLSLNGSTTTITGAVNVASLIKSGNGNVTFAGGGSLTAHWLDLQGGTTTFAAGTSLAGVTNYSLSANSTLDLGSTASPTLALAAGHTYTASGNTETTLRGSVTLNVGSRLLLGTGAASFGTVVVTNTLTLNGGALDFDLNTTAAGASDRITAAQLSLTGPTDITFRFPSGAPQIGVPYPFLTYSGALTGNAAYLTSTNTSQSYSAAFSAATPGVITVTFTVAPPTLTLVSGVRTVSSLSNTIATLTGRCELRLTATNNPLPGSLIHLNSADVSVVFQNLKPSVVVASYLARLRINGAVAIADGNCRVVPYGVGTIILPHAPAWSPLQIFSGPHFTGTAVALNRYVYYQGIGLGALNTNLSSFKLKRGYQATFAQNENGSGLSQCYVAQDGDLEVSLPPAALDNRVRFVYVLPWRWTSKKGIAGNIESGLNLQWKYNWNLDQNSTRDLEYVPIRQARWWPGLGESWQTRGANHLLGYNEPDRPDQANMSVGDAIWSWPDLLATGLRVGAPAVSDGGRASWLYPFMEQADAAGLRVDYVPVHYYWCFNPADPAGAANQMYGFLKATYDQVKRPLWITEWNNGANWTGCGDPSHAQQQAAIAAMIEMLDNTPFVERYAPYNWVEDVRRLKWDDGSLTAAGATYRDKVSPPAYVQAIPANGLRSLAQLRFETDTLDTAGYGNNGLAAGSPAFTNGVRGQALVFDGANTLVTLPANVASGGAITFAAWIKWNGGANWQRIFDFGNSTTHYLYLTPSSGSGTLRFAIKNGGGEQTVETTALAANQWRHVAVTLSGTTARLYVNGTLAASNTGMSITPASFSPRINRLGQSHFIADPLFNGWMDEVLIADYALSAAQIAALRTGNPPQFTNSSLARGPAITGQTYSGTLAGSATDADAGDTLTYSKTAGPAWLSVAANGALSGIPAASDRGTNAFTVRVTDTAGANGFAVLALAVVNPLILPAQSNRTVVELTLLRVTNTASGGSGLLSHALTNAPAGAGISPAGVITWVPSEAQGPGAYVLTTIATDGSLPPLRTTNSFTVVVLETNRPPILASLANHTLNVGQWLTVTNVATDPDLPANPLTYSFVTQPGGASLDVTNGLLSWRPPVARAGISNGFSLHVSDNGLPSLSVTQSFAVLVNPLAPVTLAPVSLTLTHFTLSLSGEAGPDYTLQTATNLSFPGAWMTALTTNLTTSPMLWEHRLPAGGSPERFYRVLVGP